MPRPRRFVPSYANITSTLALFVALGGVSYAAITLPANSVGSRQIKPRAVATSDIKGGAVTSPQVKDGSLLLKDFKPGQLQAGPAGATGAQGVQGPQGPQGPAGTVPPVEAWHVVGSVGEPQFAASWVNYDPTLYEPAAFYKDPFGVVHLRGVISGGTMRGIFQLPAGYAPARAQTFATTTTAVTFLQVTIDGSGGVLHTPAPAPSGPVSLDGISFRVG